MIAKISHDELIFMECLYDPVCLIESLFSDFDNLAKFDESFGHIRLAQLSLLSYEYIIDYNPDLTKAQNFKLREGVGNCWCLGGRNFGKTLFIEKLDIPLDMMLIDDDVVGFTSYDANHIRGILEPIISAFERHPILNMFDVKINRSPVYNFNARNGWHLESINMNIAGKSPGSGFFQKHYKKLYIEEMSFETDEVYKKRSDSISELGCVFRASGMTNFTKYSPPGYIYYDITKRPWVVNYPQYVNPNFDKQRAIKEHHGTTTPSYRVFVNGEVIEEGISVFQMDRIRPQYDDNRLIKHFEINKDNYPNYQYYIILDRPSNVNNVFVCSDIGETAPTKIIVLFEINKKYRYSYKISLHGLIDKQQKEIFKFIIEALKANIIAIDCGEGLGRVIYRYLEELYSQEHMVYYDGSKKIKVDFERDEYNNVIFKDGLPVYKEEFMSEWSVKRLKDLLYDELIILPLDYEFDLQFNSVVVKQTSNRLVYECVIPENHLFDAFRVFAIAQWEKEFEIVKPITTKAWGKIGAI